LEPWGLEAAAAAAAASETGVTRKGKGWESNR